MRHIESDRIEHAVRAIIAIGETPTGDKLVITTFLNDDEAYLAWVETHPDGFVANVDEPQRWASYPMVHRSTHKAMYTSPAR